jgi:hypothetical protein
VLLAKFNRRRYRCGKSGILEMNASQKKVWERNQKERALIENVDTMEKANNEMNSMIRRFGYPLLTKICTPFSICQF